MSESEKIIENAPLKLSNDNKIDKIIDKLDDSDPKEEDTYQNHSESKTEDADEDSKQNSDDQYEGKRMVLRNKKKTNYWKDDGEDDDDEDFWREEDDTQYVSKRRTRQSGNNTNLKQDKHVKKQKYNNIDNDLTLSMMASKKQSTRPKRLTKKSGYEEEKELSIKKRKRGSSRYPDSNSNSEYDEKEAAASLVSLADSLLVSGLGFYNPLNFSNAHIYPQYLFQNTNSNNNIKNDKKIESMQKTIPSFSTLQLNAYTPQYYPSEMQYGHLVDVTNFNQIKWKRCATHVKIAHLINLKKNMSVLEPYLQMEKTNNISPIIPHGSTNFLGKFTLPNNIKESII